MKFYKSCLPIVASAIVAVPTVFFSFKVNAQQSRFACTQTKRGYATIARTSKGERPVIEWVSNDFDAAGWSSEKRCQEVSERFQQLYVSGALKYLTTGKMNGQNVICSTTRKGGNCTGLLFTVRPGVSPRETLQKLMKARVNAGGPLSETGERLYVDMSQYLDTDTVVQEPTAAPPPPVKPSQSVPVQKDAAW